MEPVLRLHKIMVGVCFMFVFVFHRLDKVAYFRRITILYASQNRNWVDSLMTVEIFPASDNNAQLIKYGVLREMNTFGIQLCLMFLLMLYPVHLSNLSYAIPNI